MGMFLISFPHEGSRSQPVARSCSWDNCSFLSVRLIYLLILLEMQIPAQALSLPCCLCIGPDIWCWGLGD